LATRQVIGRHRIAVIRQSGATQDRRFARRRQHVRRPGTGRSGAASPAL